jgi:predicted dehydrogenase
MKPIRVSFLGCGDFAHRHAQTFQLLQDDFQPVAYCDQIIDRAAGFSKIYTGGQARVFQDHHELFEQVEMDLIVISLPPFAHSDEVELAADRSIHVFIEKPIAMTSEHAWRMVSAAEKAGIVTQVGFMYRFGEAIERAVSLIESGAAGAPGLFTGRYFCNSLHADWWRDRSKSGGQLFEQVIHIVDLMRCLMGEPEKVISKQVNYFHRDQPDYSVEDVSATIFSFPSGALGAISATNGAIPERWISDYHLVTRNLTIDFKDANRAVFTDTTSAQGDSFELSSDRDFYLAEMLDLRDAIRLTGSARMPLIEGAKTLDLVLAARQSAEQNCEINLT